MLDTGLPVADVALGTGTAVRAAGILAGGQLVARRLQALVDI